MQSFQQLGRVNNPKTHSTPLFRAHYCSQRGLSLAPSLQVFQLQSEDVKIKTHFSFFFFFYSSRSCVVRVILQIRGGLRARELHAGIYAKAFVWFTVCAGPHSSSLWLIKSQEGSHLWDTCARSPPTPTFTAGRRSDSSPCLCGDDGWTDWRLQLRETPR